MFNPKEHIGFAVDHTTVDLARVKQKGKHLELVEFRRIELAEPLASRTTHSDPGGTGAAGRQGGESEDDVFGISEEPKTVAEPSEEAGDIEELDELEELDDLSELDVFDLDVEEQSPDLVEEAGHPDSNEILLHDYLTGLNGRDKRYIGINIRSGETLFQFLPDSDYANIKSRELREIVENRLYSVHGNMPDPGSFNYHLDDSNRLCIASVSGEPESLRLINRLHDISGRKKIYVEEILPDEMALVGFYRIHYPVPENESSVTALIQLRENHCRIIFLKDHRIIRVMPVINEGTSHMGVLSTIFSKLLFQLDTGEVPGMDRILLCDNTLGDEAIEYFSRHFPDVTVSEFIPDSELLKIPETFRDQVGTRTTAMAIATASTGAYSRQFPPLSIIPGYIPDRQKIFQLQWHGILLLIAIGLAPVVLNHYYQSNREQIEELRQETQRIESLISELEETVQETAAMEELLAAHQEQLVLLYDLSEETVRWTATFDHINRSVSDIGGLWVTTFRHSPQGLLLEGFALQEERIPRLARSFGRVTLVNVQSNELRERPVWRFSMRIPQVVEDTELYTPEFSRDIMPFLESMEGL